MYKSEKGITKNDKGNAVPGEENCGLDWYLCQIGECSRNDGGMGDIQLDKDDPETIIIAVVDVYDEGNTFYEGKRRCVNGFDENHYWSSSYNCWKKRIFKRTWQWR